jgi:integrase
VNGAIVLTKNKTGKPRIVPLRAGLSARDFPYGLTDREVSHAYREARAKAGMPWLQFRDLRRTFGSWIVQKPRASRPRKTFWAIRHRLSRAKHYAHLLEGDLRKAIATLPDVAGMARGRGKRRKRRK